MIARKFLVLLFLLLYLVLSIFFKIIYLFILTEVNLDGTHARRSLRTIGKKNRRKKKGGKKPSFLFSSLVFNIRILVSYGLSFRQLLIACKDHHNRLFRPIFRGKICWSQQLRDNFFFWPTKNSIGGHYNKNLLGAQVKRKRDLALVLND